MVPGESVARATRWFGAVSVFLMAWPSAGLAQAEKPAATGVGDPPVIGIHVFPADAGAEPMATRTLDVLSRKAAADGYRVEPDARIGQLLDRSPEDLVRAAAGLETGRKAYAEALEQNTRLRLEQAQEGLLRARGAFLEASAAPSYADLRNVHLYLGIIGLNLGQPEAAAINFRQVAFLAPQMALKTDVFPPSVVESYAQTRRAAFTGPKGALRIEADVKGALVVIDGAVRGSAPRLLTEVPEGTHYLEVRAPGHAPHLQTIDVTPGIETPVVVSLKPIATALREVWSEERGAAGLAAMARILEADRIAIASVRTTVAGVSPYAIQGVSVAANGGMQRAETSTARDNPTTDQRLQAFASDLLAKTRGGAGAVSVAAIAARRARILDRESSLVVFETGMAYQSMVFDGHGRYVTASTQGQDNRYDPDQDFNSYLETRTQIHMRYGLRQNVTAMATIPFYTKDLRYRYDEDGSGTIESSEENVRREDVGIGDIVVGADVRLPKWEVGPFTLVYATGRIKLPTGASTTQGFLRQYQTLVMGSGQFDLYGALGGVIASGEMRFGMEAGYNARLPDRVWYYNYGRARRHLNPGDEEHLKLSAAMHMGRWLAPELYLNFVHRHATQKFIDPITHDFGEAREMYLADLGLAMRAEFSERTNAGLVFQHPVWGKTTQTFFPLDVTGPRLYLYYGVRY